MKRLFIFIMIAVSIALTWLAWNPPSIQSHLTRIHMAIPETPSLNAGPWRVMTRRMISKQAVDGMKRRLLEADFHPELVQKREPVELHAFDDPRIFKKQSEAGKIKAKWRALGVEADVLHHLSKDDEKVFKVGLGRFYMSEYAEAMQKQLKKSKQPYNYERRTVSIPSYHFIFPATTKGEAEILWKRLQNMGIADPVIIQQSEFKRLYPQISVQQVSKTIK